MNTIVLGSEVKDKVTGFKGVAVARVEYLNGCAQYCVKPKMAKDGKMPEGQYIDDDQLEVIGKGIVIPVDNLGGPSSDTPSGIYHG
jgi:hypothetical protein